MLISNEENFIIETGEPSSVADSNCLKTIYDWVEYAKDLVA